MIKISLTMAAAILAMYANNWISYRDESDVTMLALKERGFVTYRRAARYGKHHWVLTDTGLFRASQLKNEAEHHG